MFASFQRHLNSLLDIVSLSVHGIIIMHAASVAFLLHGVLLASLAGLIIRSNFSAQTLLLIGLLLNIHPKLLSYIHLPPGSIQELTHSVEARALPIIREKLVSIQNEATPQAKGRRDNFERQPGFMTASVDNPCREFTSLIYEDNSKFMEAETPRTPNSLTRKLRKSLRGRGTFDDEKENEPSPLRPVTERGTTPCILHRSGLRPLTLTNNPPLNFRDSFGPRRTVSLFSSAKRPSPLFHVFGGSEEHLPPTWSARSTSLPPDGHLGQGEIQLISKLREEMKLTARLRNDLVELRGRACAELNQSKDEAQALAVAVNARECFIKDLAASVELLRVENKVLKKANRRDLCQNNVPTDLFTARNIDENIHSFSPKIKTQELEQEDVNILNITNQPSGGSKSAQERRLEQRRVKRSSIASGYLSGTTGLDLGEHSVSRDALSWLSLGSVSEPTLEPLRGSRASIRASPPTLSSDNVEYCVYAMATSERYFEVEFPTISPEFPPCHTAALARSKVATPSKGTIIYEVDGRALAATLEDLASPPHFTDPAGHSPRHLLNERYDSTCLASKQTCHGEASCLAIQQDSPFFAVPASDFIVPRAMCPSSGRCP